MIGRKGAAAIADYYDLFAIWHIHKKSAIYSILLWYDLVVERGRNGQTLMKGRYRQAVDLTNRQGN